MHQRRLEPVHGADDGPDAPTASTAAATTAPSVAPSASTDACAAATLPVLTAGKLTIGTDNPAYPPYFAENADGHKTAPWELGDPTNGLGFESAFAYALAAKMGFPKEQVAWTYVPFDSSYKPGAKTFDIDINQVSDTPERRVTVDLSDGYYFLNQAVVSLAANPVAKVTSIADLAKYRFGAQDGDHRASRRSPTSSSRPPSRASTTRTTPRSPDSRPSRSTPSSSDLPTAFYMTVAQLDKGTVVGQFKVADAVNVEHVGVVLAKDSPITPCVNAAIGAMTARRIAGSDHRRNGCPTRCRRRSSPRSRRPIHAAMTAREARR